MQAAMSIEQLVIQLNKVREEQGEEAFQTARHEVALSIVLKPNGETFVRNAFPDMDIEALKKEAEETAKEAAEATAKASPELMMLNMMRSQIPNMKTQGEFNAFMGAFEALRVTANALLGRDTVMADKGRQALDQALELLGKIPDMKEQIQEMPEDQRSGMGEDMLRPAKELHEHDLKAQLHVELASIEDMAHLNRWWEANRERLDGIISQSLRNEVFDAIRAKKKALRDAQESQEA